MFVFVLLITVSLDKKSEQQPEWKISSCSVVAMLWSMVDLRRSSKATVLTLTTLCGAPSASLALLISLEG